jgi:death-on-curing protein
VQYLEPLDLIVINQAETGVRGGTVADLGLVYAAVIRPRAFVAGVEAYLEVFSKAAAMLHSIATWHPFAQGNFATAITAAFMMCEFNGFTIVSADDKEEMVLAEAAASGALGVEQIADILRHMARPS